MLAAGWQQCQAWAGWTAPSASAKSCPPCVLLAFLLLLLQALHKIEETWRNMNLIFSAYQDTDIGQFSVDDTIIETLESDNLTLQNLLGGKYVQVWRVQARTD